MSRYTKEHCLRRAENEKRGRGTRDLPMFDDVILAISDLLAAAGEPTLTGGEGT